MTPSSSERNTPIVFTAIPFPIEASNTSARRIVAYRFIPHSLTFDNALIFLRVRRDALLPYEINFVLIFHYRFVKNIFCQRVPGVIGNCFRFRAFWLLQGRG
jgi:hypothetical protein